VIIEDRVLLFIDMESSTGLMLRSLGYLAVILMGLTVSAWLLRESAERPSGGTASGGLGHCAFG
jgi:hypothetical protein